MRPVGFHHTEETKRKMRLNNGLWNKGLTKEIDERVKKQSIALTEHWQVTPHPKGMLGKQHSFETKKKMSNHRQRELNAHWKGGVTAEYNLHHNNPEWAKRRLECYQRDSYTCRICGKKGNGPRSLQAHHIVPWRISRDDSLSNLITCCLPCHRKSEGKLLEVVCY